MKLNTGKGRRGGFKRDILPSAALPRAVRPEPVTGRSGNMRRLNANARALARSRGKCFARAAAQQVAAI